MRLLSGMIIALLCSLEPQFAHADAGRNVDPDFEAVRERLSFPVYNYDMTIKTGETLDIEVVTRIDMTKPKGQRIELVSSTDPKVVDTVMKEIRGNDSENDNLGDIWCDQLSSKVPDTYTTTETSDQTRTIKFVPVAKTEEQRAIFPHLIGEMTLDAETASVMGLKLVNTSSFKPSPIAKIRELEIVYTCQALENGMLALDSYSANVKGKALFQSFKETEVMHWSNFHPVDSK
ncbi:hypothetical protein [Hyphococcus lacteus]|uniref:DUF4424 domain-containing protein n=1 Tax=Hyphococcus lacteus TaxID=3143536 RepID=A0ABV3Z7J3_9PROT